MTQNKDYPLRFLEIVARVINERKKQGLYSREVKQKRLEVRPKLSCKKIGVANDNSLKIANVTIKKKRLPKRKNKYISIPIPAEKKTKKTNKSTLKIAKKSKSKNSGSKGEKVDKSRAKDSALKKPKEPRTRLAKGQPTKAKRSNLNKTQNIVTLEPYINAQPKKVTLSLDGVKQDSSQNKSDIPMKYPLERIVLGELKEPRNKSIDKGTKRNSEEGSNKEKLNPLIDSSSKRTFSEEVSSKKAKAKQVASNKKAKDSKSKKSKTKKPISKSKRSIREESNNDKKRAQNKEELLSKIKTLEDWMAKVKGAVNDKTMKNLEKKLSTLKARVSNMK